MISKKKLLSLSAVLLAVSSINALAETKEIRFSWWGGNQRHQATLAAVREFETLHPDIKIKAEPSGWDGYLAKLTTQIAGKTEPDVMQVNWNWMVIFSKDGKGFYDINKVNNIIDLSQFSTQAKEMSSRKGILNAVPVSMTGRSMYYNQQLWRQVGLAYPTTWQELLAAGKVFKDKLGDEYYPLMLANHDTTIMTFLNSYMVQKYNKTMIDEDNKKFAFTPQEWREFFGLYRDLTENHVIPSMKYFAARGKTNAWELAGWMDGKFGGVHTWSTDNTFSGSLPASAAQLEVGPYPLYPSATDVGVFYKPSMMLAIGKTSKHPKEAAMLIEFLLNADAGIEKMSIQRGVPLSKHAMQYLTSIGIVNPDQLQVQGLKQVETLMGNIQPSPYMENPQLLSLFLEKLEKYSYEKISFDELVESFPKDGERLLKRVM